MKSKFWKSVHELAQLRKQIPEERRQLSTVRASVLSTNRPKPLSKEEQDKRKPRPPEELVDALQDRIHPTSGRIRVAKSIKNPHAVALGRLGGAAGTEKQKKSSRVNGAKGGRPKSIKKK